MDTSETYIKMCEKATEIQTLEGEAFGSFYSTGDIVRLGIFNNYQGIWLPRQDQLQEIVVSSPETRELLGEIERGVEPHGNNGL